MNIVRLSTGECSLAQMTFVMMGEVFGDYDRRALRESYLTMLLGRADIWVYAAVVDMQPVGGLIAHEVPMTRSETSELLVYDLAVRPDWQRRGTGRGLIQRLLEDAAAAGIPEEWVPADNDDSHALEFYRRTGGSAQAVTIFTYPTRSH